MTTPNAEIVVPCTDLAVALESLLAQGLRLESIHPADDPREAVVSGRGVRLRLVRSPEDAAPSGDWRTGRAGMRYRDLLLDRLGGRVIASHIRIERGGPVADYVHYHVVAFQLIYCAHGWVRVVYEDQGEPFVLRAGDAVLQPPTIRHRVLECSPGLEVFEVTAPAEHETRADHERSLPTATLEPQRVYAGQRFARHRADTAAWQPWRLPGFAARDLGIATATAGVASAHVVRVGAAEGVDFAELPGAAQRLLCCVRGTATLEQGGETRPLRAGTAHALAADAPHALRTPSDDLELLEVVLAAPLFAAPPPAQ